MQITSGKIATAQKVIIYGVEGIGKSTFASKFPNPVFIDTEGSTLHMDVKRTQRPTSWTMMLGQVAYICDHPSEYQTLVIDTADWAETLGINHICAKLKINGIEEIGYGKGYTYLEEEFGRFLNLLQDVVDRGVNVVLTAHAQMRKFEQPDELGAYDRWELKLEKKTSALVKEWADMVLFANFKTMVVNVDNQGAVKGKNKAQGGQRVMYASHHPCWDAKNRHGLPDEMPFDYAAIASVISSRTPTAPAMPSAVAQTAPAPAPANIPAPAQEARQEPPAVSDKVPKALRDLMIANSVTEAEIQATVAKKGYYPRDTPVENYDPNFVAGVLVGAWPQVYQAICDEAMPFKA